MRLSQFVTTDGTKNWGIDTSTVAGYNAILAASGDYVYCQGSSEQTIQKRNRVDGSLVWQKDFVTGSAQPIKVDLSHNLYTLSAGVLRKYDSNGNLLWSYDTEDAQPTYVGIRDISADGSKILLCRMGDFFVPFFEKMYVVNSSGVLVWSKQLERYSSLNPAVFDSNNDIVALNTALEVRKYSGTDGTEIWLYENNNVSTSGLCVDISDNVWLLAAGKITKLGKNTGNVLLQSADTFTFASGDYWYLFPVSNGNIAFVRYDVSETDIVIDIRDGNAIQQEEETHADITAFNSAVITV